MIRDVRVISERVGKSRLMVGGEGNVDVVLQIMDGRDQISAEVGQRGAWTDGFVAVYFHYSIQIDY